jgi:hypothetical protein
MPKGYYNEKKQAMSLLFQKIGNKITFRMKRFV